MSSRGMRAVTGAALATAVLAAQATAVSEAPRQIYSDRFTTDVPGASAGRNYAIDYVNPEDPDGKPHAFSHLRVELADGARFDTSALPRCGASDAELMAVGPAACPAETLVGKDETILDTGFPDPGRHVTVDFNFFNNENELILLATVRENGARVVVRGQIGTNTLDIENPMVPGTPPEGGAAKSQRGQFQPHSSANTAGVQRNYITTPPTCPPSGYWVNRVVYTYRDGVTQAAESKSPCRRGAGRSDERPPRVRAAGIPRPCTRTAFRARVRVSDASGVRWTRVRLNGRRIATASRERFGVRVAAARLRPGTHTLTVTALDAAGNRGERSFHFRRCGR